MEIFNEKSEFYKKKVINHYKGPIIKWLVFSIFMIILFFNESIIDEFILIPLSILWGFTLVGRMNNHLKETKKKYYPNGQLRSKISVSRFNPGVNYKGPLSIKSETKWYENGQKKSYKHYVDGKIDNEEYWDKNGKKKPKKKTTTKTKKVEKKKSNFGKQYHDLEKTLLGKNSSYNEEYGFIKSLREKLKSGEVYLEDMSGYIKNHHKKYDGGEIMTKTELYNQLEHIFTVYLEDWEKKKETTFIGFEDVEQYHSLSQKIVIELGDLLQEKIMELGK